MSKQVLEISATPEVIPLFLCQEQQELVLRTLATAIDDFHFLPASAVTQVSRTLIRTPSCQPPPQKPATTEVDGCFQPTY